VHLFIILQDSSEDTDPRDRDSMTDSLRKTATNTATDHINGMPMTKSDENSRNASRESNVNERSTDNDVSTSNNKKSISTDSTTMNNTDASNATIDEEKIATSVHSLIQEYTENYSDSTDRPIKVSHASLKCEPKLAVHFNLGTYCLTVCRRPSKI
jgi:hypothetical protein